MVASLEQGKTYRRGDERMECLWAGDSVESQRQFAAVRYANGEQDAAAFCPSEWAEVKPLPAFPSGWTVLCRSGGTYSGYSSREDAEEGACNVRPSAVALLEYHPETRTVAVYELSDQ